jgi:hypothetical protein
MYKDLISRVLGYMMCWRIYSHMTIHTGVSVM